MNRPDDDRHRQTADVDFTRAPAIFPNNDIKYEVNKRRAYIFAAAHGLCLTWCPAKDRPSTLVLNEKPNITEEKTKWLQRHDKECGDLYGLVPLALGLPMAVLTLQKTLISRHSVGLGGKGGPFDTSRKH